jgi:hypothetical protein
MMNQMINMWHQITTTKQFRMEEVFQSRFLIVFGVVLVGLLVAEGVPPDAEILEMDNSKVSSDHEMNKESQRLWELVNGCTHRLTVNAAGALEIGIGVRKNDGTFIASEFRWEQLEDFYRKQPEKKIAAIIVDPSPDEKGLARSKDVSDKLLALGYSRVVVVQNTGSGYVLVHDKMNPRANQ